MVYKINIIIMNLVSEGTFVSYITILFVCLPVTILDTRTHINQGCQEMHKSELALHTNTTTNNAQPLGGILLPGISCPVTFINAGFFFLHFLLLCFETGLQGRCGTHKMLVSLNLLTLHTEHQCGPHTEAQLGEL